MLNVAASRSTATETGRLTIIFSRFVAWASVAILIVFLLNFYLNFWRDWPGAGILFTTGAEASAAAWLQTLFYLLALVLPAVFVLRTGARNPRRDNQMITALAAYVARFAFWAVLLVGLVDAVISFLRVEELLSDVVGEAWAQNLGRNQFRGPSVHLPLIILALILAAMTRTLGFTWLVLLVVIAELQIVISRFVFSYEQAFMGDLVRFWYAGLFLFSSAYTLVEEGHVRVDVLYAGMSERSKGLVNAWGSLLLGLPLCWVVLIVGMGQPSSIISSPLLALEISQQGFGMFVKYLMAAMLAIFAITMALQFAGYFLQGVADYYELPGERKSESESASHAPA